MKATDELKDYFSFNCFVIVFVLSFAFPIIMINANLIDDRDSSVVFMGQQKWYPSSGLPSNIWKNGTATSHVVLYSTAVYTHNNCTRLQWLATKGPDRGIADVYVDDIFRGSIDQYSPFLAPSNVIFDSGNMKPGKHTIKIILNGKKSSFSTNFFVEIDAFDVTPSNGASGGNQNQQKITIMPLGDSITYGYIDGVSLVKGGYRSHLWNLLKSNNFNVDFVGSLVNGTLEDRNHEGYPTYRIDQITSLIDFQGIMNVKPKYVLLHIGTNDALQSYQIYTIKTRISYLIDRVLANMQGGGKLYVAKVPLCGFSHFFVNLNILYYNGILTQVVNEKIAQGKPVVLVDMSSKVSAYDLADQIHPTEYGYQKMADTWFNAIKNDLK